MRHRTDACRLARALACVVLGACVFAGRGGAQTADAPLVHVPVANKAKLQSLLDQHRAIRLDAAADYRGGPRDVLTVSSGQTIVGGWNTRVPRVVIPGGVSHVRIVAVRSDGWTAPDIEFTGGAVNDDIEIVGGTGGPGTQIRVAVRDGARVNRLSLSEYGGLTVEQASSGYIHDSTFTRLLGYWPGPHVTWHGNSREPSRGNAFLGLASITPATPSVWRDAGDLWFVNWDCESWSAHGKEIPRCFVLEGATRVVSVGLGGGTATPERSGALASFRDVPLLVNWFPNLRGGALDGADLILDHVGTLITVQPEGGLRVSDTAGSTRWRILDADPARGGARVATSGVANATVAQRAVLAATFAGVTTPPVRQKPRARAIVDPLGADWTAGIGAQPDAAASIQARIDAESVVRLAPGVYYLDRPLRLGNHRRIEGLIGKSRKEVVLVAKGAFPVISGRGDIGRDPHAPKDALVTLALEGLTLYGGTHALDWTGERGNLGPGGVVAWSAFEDLALLKQSVAAVHASGIGGLDSNLWRRVDITDTPIAFRGDGTGAGPGMTYADKQHFLDCQYQRIADTVWYWTSDRPSGGAVFADNVYLDVGRATRTRAANHLLWSNSVFENVTGDVALDVTDAGSTGTYYFTMVDSVWRGRGARVVTDTQSWQVGTLFVDTEFAQSGGSLVAADGEQTLFGWRSRITGSALVGAVHSGVFIDSALGAFDQPLQLVERGVVTAVAGTP
jgi:hypothetical protein